MKLFVRLVLLAALLVLSWWLWVVFFPSPEKVIRKRLAELAQATSFAANEGDFARLGNIAQLGGFFSPDAQIVLDAAGYGAHNLSGRDEIMQAAGAARTATTSLKVEFLDLNVALDFGRELATVDLTVRGKTGNDPNFFVQEMKFNLKRINGRWFIIRVEPVKTLS
jgi:hypothetical protein